MNTHQFTTRLILAGILFAGMSATTPIQADAGKKIVKITKPFADAESGGVRIRR